MLVMSALVFVGVYAIGNPIDVLIAPDVTQEIRARDHRALRARPAALASSTSSSCGALLQGDFGRSFVYDMPVLDLILSRLPATLEMTLLGRLSAPR